MITKQAVYNHVRDHLLRQGEKSVGPDGEACVYRGPNGTSCAVGCLIPESRYSSSLEGLTLEAIAVQMAVFGKPATLRTSPHVGMFWLLYMLQKVHDQVSVPQWEQELRRVALEAGLVP